jgi:beta-glucosidase
MEIYKNPDKPVEERVNDLIGKMTVQEKVAQLTCSIVISGGDAAKQAEQTLANGVGTISYINISLTGDNQKDMDTLKETQRFLVEKTRLGIPALAHSEGIAGAQIPGATTFPQSIGQAAAWEPELIRKMGEAVKKQIKAYGIKAVHSPLFDMGRDPRWGRIGETYGEDPYLVAQMGTAFVEGIQGDNEVMAAAKHFIAYGNTEGGRNGGEQQFGTRKLLDIFCFPFEAAIHVGKVAAVMNSYGIVNEEPVASSKWLLTEILRDKLGFTGPVVSDYGSISHNHFRYRTASSPRDAAIKALKAGIDVEQPQNTIFQHLVEAVETGELEEAFIDKALRRILKVKFELGLFENPCEEGDFFAEIQRKTNNEFSLRIAEKSIVLVKNENNTLPIKKPLKIALIGPSANNKANLFGGYSSVGSVSATSSDFDKSQEDNFIKMAYTAYITDYKSSLEARDIVFDDQPSPEQKEQIMALIRQGMSQTNKPYKNADDFIAKYYPSCKSVREALEDEFGRENVFFAPGCEINKPIEGGIEAAVVMAKKADVVIAVLGGRESMKAPEATAGENKDNINIDLEKPQRDMMDAIFKLDKPVISIIIDARPLAAATLNEKSRAVLYAWLPAQEGASAIVNTLTGKNNPGGKLPVTIVRDVGQIPLYYSRLPFYADLETWAEYIDNTKNRPLYPFGHGLSYTTFAYGDLSLPAAAASDGTISLSFSVKNTGTVTGDEVAQIYVRDCESSIGRPVKQLAGFARVNLNPGERKTVIVEFDMRQFAFHDIEMKQVVEPGLMEVYIGSSSEDIRLKGAFEITGKKLSVERKAFFSKVMVQG